MKNLADTLAGAFDDDNEQQDEEVSTLEQPVRETLIPNLSLLKEAGAVVEVRPIEKPQWHGKTGKESFTQAKTIECLFDKLTGGYATGLTKEEEEHYGALMGVKLDNVFLADQEHPYWSTKGAQVRLENHTMFFNSMIPSEYVKIKNMRASKYVANSMQEYLDGKWPDATHVIYDEKEQVAIKATKLLKKREAEKYIAKMSMDDKINVLLLLSKKTIKNRSNDYIEVELNDVMEENIDGFIDTIKLGREEVNIRGKLTDALARDILTREGAIIYYMGEPIAMDFEDLIRWFRDPQNSIIKVRILDKLSQ